MQTHRTQAIVSANGSLVIEKLPFASGETVEVVVSNVKATPVSSERYPLRGTSIKFDDPTGSVAQSDWEVLP